MLDLHRTVIMVFCCKLAVSSSFFQAQDLDRIDVGWASVWVKAGAQWVTSLLYCWTLMAPAMFPGEGLTLNPKRLPTSNQKRVTVLISPDQCAVIPTLCSLPAWVPGCNEKLKSASCSHHCFSALLLTDRDFS
jgi:hypothetical protein